MTNIIKYASTVIALSVVTFGVAVQPAAAQQMGRDGYSFPARNSSMSAQFQFQRSQNASAQSSSDAGLSALTQYSNVYNSSSTAIANMNSVTQNLSDGSTGMVDTSGDQDSDGSQDSEATSDVAIDNSVTDSGNLTEILQSTVPVASE